MTAGRYQLVASASLIALIFLCLGWELWWAPLKPGGSWLALKAVFLLAPLFGILRGKRYTYKWTSLLVQLYLLEGLVRATSDSGLAQRLAMLTNLPTRSALTRCAKSSRLRSISTTLPDDFAAK